MTLPTVKSLSRRKGIVWADKASVQCSDLEVLFWHATRLLACFIEQSAAPADMPKASPASVEVLRGAASYFKSIDEPLPLPVARVLLRIDRVNAGLPDT